MLQSVPQTGQKLCKKDVLMVNEHPIFNKYLISIITHCTASVPSLPLQISQRWCITLVAVCVPFPFSSHILRPHIGERWNSTILSSASMKAWHGTTANIEKCSLGPRILREDGWNDESYHQKYVQNSNPVYSDRSFILEQYFIALVCDDRCISGGTLL